MQQNLTNIKKEFLGWNKPFISLLVDWLWDYKQEQGELTDLLIVVPTDASAVRLRMALAQRGGCLSPRIETPDTWQKELQKLDEQIDGLSGAVAPLELEHQLWLDLLNQPYEQMRWKSYSTEAFNLTSTEANLSKSTDTYSNAVLSKNQVRHLAQSIADLRRYLAKSALNLAQGSASLEGSFEQRKWKLLADWEQTITAQLAQVGLLGLAEAKQEYLRNKSFIAKLPEQVVLAGVSQLEGSQKAYYQVYLDAGCKVTHLIAAPQSLEFKFNEWGLPLTQAWLEHKFNMLDVVIAQTAYEQADAVVSILNNWQAKAKISNADVSLIVIKPQHAHLIENTVTQAGWNTKSLAPKSLDTHIWTNCLKAWIAWLEQPTWDRFRALIDYPMVASYLGMSVYELVAIYDNLMQSLLLPEHKSITAINDWQLYGASQEHQDVLAPLVNQLMLERRRCLSLNQTAALVEWLEQGFLSLTQLQNIQGSTSVDEQEIKTLLKCWFDYISNVEKWQANFEFKVLDILNMLASKTAKQVQPSYDTQVELLVRGWAEMMYESAPWLILTDLNEGSLPENIGGEPWLYPEIKQALSLAGDDKREARDAYLLAYAMASRSALASKNQGGIKGLLIKKDKAGNLYEPCRFLMRVQLEFLAKRVLQLQVEEPEVKKKMASFTQDWQLDLNVLGEPASFKRMSASKLQDYMACPRRFLLKHGYGMEPVHEQNHELQAQDLGNIAHHLLDDFASDEELKNSTEAVLIRKWIKKRLDQIFYAHFGDSLPLNLLLQKQSLFNRLNRWAESQAEHRKQGWQIKYTEYKMEVNHESFTLVGKIDRIDYHPDKGWLLIDYKVQNKVRAKDNLKCKYLQKITANTQNPQHLQSLTSLQVEELDKKGEAITMQWQQLQLPLYAYLWEQSHEYYSCREPIALAYGCLPPELDDVGYSFWQNYDANLSESAWRLSCELMNQIEQGVFEPMNQAVKYDDLGLWNLKQGVNSFA